MLNLQAQRARLAQPMSLPCGVVLSNRLAKAGMSEQLATPDLQPSTELVHLYERWARSGASLIITGNVMIDAGALVEARNEVIDGEAALPRFSQWASAAQSHQGQCWLQLNHPGRQTAKVLSRQPVAPSAVPIRVGGLFAVPRELSPSEIEALVHKFALGAELAKRAGFGGVQIHAAHGYLVSQFLSPRANLRTDAWGGSPEKRRRFLLEIVKEVRRRVGDRYPIGVKLNSADFQRGGFDEDEALQVAVELEKGGIDLLEVSGGNYESAAMMGAGSERTREREAYFLDFAAKLRKRIRIPIMLTGGFRTTAAMAAAVESGAIDVVGLARPMVIEPELPGQLLSGEKQGSGIGPKGYGIRKLDGLLELYWYGLQLRRLGLGFEPDPGMSRLKAVAYALRENLGSSERTERAVREMSVSKGRR